MYVLKVHISTFSDFRFHFIGTLILYSIKMYFIFGTIMKLQRSFQRLIFFVQLNLANIKRSTVVNISLSESDGRVR